MSDKTVSLTDAAGVAVAATRKMVGNTLVVDPETDLEPGTTYEFVVSSGLRTEQGIAVTENSSTFTTGAGGTVAEPGSGLALSRERVVFSAGGASSEDTQTLTLANVSGETIEIMSLGIGGDAAKQFSLADSSASSPRPGEARELALTFVPSSLGPQQATLSVESSDPVSGTLEVPLGGLGIEGQGGNLEPSLQWILDAYGLPINTGDPDPTSTPLLSAPTSQAVGGEVTAKTFSKASETGPVTVEVLAAFGVENDPVLEFGYYAAGQAGARTQLFEVAPDPGLNEQRLAPEITTSDAASSAAGSVDGTFSFDPGAENFGFYSFWPTNKFFGERYVYTEDKLNTFASAIPRR